MDERTSSFHISIKISLRAGKQRTISRGEIYTHTRAYISYIFVYIFRECSPGIKLASFPRGYIFEFTTRNVPGFREIRLALENKRKNPREWIRWCVPRDFIIVVACHRAHGRVQPGKMSRRFDTFDYSPFQVSTLWLSKHLDFLGLVDAGNKNMFTYFFISSI